MSVRQILGQLGDWSITLKPETPLSIRSLPELRDHFIIVPGYVTDSDANAASLFALARYSGVVSNEITDRLTFGGAPLLYWLGDGQSPSHGPFEGSCALPATFATQISTMLYLNGLTMGTNYGSSAYAIVDDTFNLHAGAFAFGPAREQLDRLAAYGGDEWRVNPDRKIDYGQPGSLWKSGANIDTVITQEQGGTEADGLNGLRASRFTVKESGAAWTYRLKGVDSSGGGIGSSAFNAVDSFGPDGSTVAGGEIWISVTTTNATDATNAVAAGITQHTDTVTVSVEVDTPDVGRYMTKGMPGDWVYAYDLDTGIVDAAVSNPPIYRGQQLPARQDLRIIEANWPVSSYYSVFHIATAGGTNTVTNLSPYVEFETGTTTLTLAQLVPLSLRKAITGYHL